MSILLKPRFLRQKRRKKSNSAGENISLEESTRSLDTPIKIDLCSLLYFIKHNNREKLHREMSNEIIKKKNEKYKSHMHNCLLIF
jgi:hypothetical protein